MKPKKNKHMNTKPTIKSFDIENISDISLSGLVVIIGPNSSGKTQLLHDLNSAICGKLRDLVVAQKIQYQEPSSFEEYFEHLLREGIITERANDQFSKKSLQFGTDEGGGDFRKSKIQSQYNAFLQLTDQKQGPKITANPYLTQMGPLSCSALFLKNRLDLVDTCPNYDHKSQGPTKTLQALYWSKETKNSFYKEMLAVFNKSLWVDNTIYQMLAIRVAEGSEIPTSDDRLEPAIMEKFRTIETEGDGLRSYAAICVTLLLETRPLCLLDEPEMCLHPPQALAMGRFIGNNTKAENCTVVATHSGHILRGILGSNTNATVIRLNNKSGNFTANILSSKSLVDATSKPRSRSESILEGLFSHAVVLCEAEGDRIVYESAYRTMELNKLDIKFIPSEGTGGVHEPLNLYHALNVPSVVIADIDFVAKNGELKKVLKGLKVSDEEIKDLSKQANKIIQAYSQNVQKVDHQSIKDSLESVSSEITESTDLSGKIRGKIMSIAKQTYKLNELKSSGIAGIPDDVMNLDGSQKLNIEFSEFLETLKKFGLFVIPVGELESWLPVLMNGQSKEDKAKWAILAAEKIEHIGFKDDDVWAFIKGITDYLISK